MTRATERLGIAEAHHAYTDQSRIRETSAMTLGNPMRRIVGDLHGVTVEIVERPQPGPLDALVRMSVTGVCGSDTHAVHGSHPFIPLPYHPGHEVVGTVESIGDDVTAVSPGQRVTVEPTLPCAGPALSALTTSMDDTSRELTPDEGRCG
jgi:Alcohol dehydrogenase GroES-like domain